MTPAARCRAAAGRRCRCGCARPTHEAVTKNGLRITRRLELPPGRYQIHVGARETSSGKLGTIRQDLDVPDFSKAPLLMSGIALTSESAGAHADGEPRPGFKDVLARLPDRDSRVSRAATRSRSSPRSTTTRRRAAHRVAITTTVAGDDGRVLFTTEDERNSKDLQGKKGGYGYTAKIPLAKLAPGRYVLRVEARTLLTNGGTASRELEFRVR